MLDDLLDELQQALEGRSNFIKLIPEEDEASDLYRFARYEQIRYWQTIMARISYELEAERRQLE